MTSCLPALTNSEREQYWDRGKAVRGVVRRAPGRLACGLDVVHRLHGRRWRSRIVLAVSPAARDIASRSSQARATGLRVPGVVSALTATFAAGAVGREFGFEFGEREAAQHERGAGVDPPHLSPASHAPARGGPLPGRRWRACRAASAAGPGRALAQPALDRPADDGMSLAQGGSQRVTNARPMINSSVTHRPDLPLAQAIVP